jgi:hypothetical protein
MAGPFRDYHMTVTAKRGIEVMTAPDRASRTGFASGMVAES